MSHLRWTSWSWVALGVAATLSVPSPAAAEEPSPTIVLRGLVAPPPASDDVAPAQRREIERAIAAYQQTAAATTARKVDGLALYPFFPQAGRHGRDLFMFNFTDLDPSTGTRDWDCSAYTYDGHQGHDSSLRSFREQDLGVPVYAVLDGTVVAAHDGEFDRNTEWLDGALANFVVLDHGGGHQTLYLHFRQGSVAVAVGQTVFAGTQLGLTASSGFSSGPHLHFESRRNGAWYEPSTGACKTGASQWRRQPLPARDLRAGDLYVSDAEIPCCVWPLVAEDLDPRLRRASFPRGPRTLHIRTDVHALPGGSDWNLRLLDPRGTTVSSESGSFEYPMFARIFIIIFEIAHDFQTVGNWRIQVRVNDALLADAPIRIVATAAQARNRPPRAVRVSLDPPRPTPAAPVECLVETSAIHEDPDYDLVRYTFEWRQNNRVLRRSTNAALSDVLARNLLIPGQRLQCKVTPLDWQKKGPTAAVTARVEPAG